MTKNQKVSKLVEQLLSEPTDKVVHEGKAKLVAPKPSKMSDAMKKSYQSRRDLKAAGSKFKPAKTPKVSLAK